MRWQGDTGGSARVKRVCKTVEGLEYVDGKLHDFVSGMGSPRGYDDA